MPEGNCCDSPNLRFNVTVPSSIWNLLLQGDNASLPTSTGPSTETLAESPAESPTEPPAADDRTWEDWKTAAIAVCILLPLLLAAIAFRYRQQVNILFRRFFRLPIPDAKSPLRTPEVNQVVVPFAGYREELPVNAVTVPLQAHNGAAVQPAAQPAAPQSPSEPPLSQASSAVPGAFAHEIP